MKDILYILIFYPFVILYKYSEYMYLFMEYEELILWNNK